MEDDCTALNRVTCTPLGEDKTICIAPRMVHMLRDIEVCNESAYMLPVPCQYVRLMDVAIISHLTVRHA